ncbi:AMT1-1 [Symbiodinium sp. CCMP2592]|nr:AMT1-1 [Symbiodinium sp. CCMP2592]
MRAFKVLLACLPLAMAGELSALNMQLEALRAEVQAQNDLISDQASKLDSYAQSRRLQTWVTQTDYDTAVAQLKADDYSLGGAMDSAWLCLCGALVMFMHAGFAMLETGSCRAKNASNVLMKNLVNVTFGTIGWWVFGWAFAYGTLAGGFIGTDGFFGIGFYTKDANDVITPNSCDADGCQSTMLSWFFQWAFCTAGATIVSGGVAERVKSPTYAAYAFVMTSFIYPVVVAWTWNYGWLDTIFDVGYMDFAGSGIVHLTGGVSALAGTIVLGPRKGRFENPEEFESHNLPLVVLGTFALWFGWYGFNPGSTLGMHTGDTGAMAAQVAMNTTISAATGGLTVFMLRYGIYKKYDVGGLCNGILAGLVSITAPCGNVECGSAFAIGFIGALVYQAASMFLQKMKIDDPVDASPVHGFCGVWGLLAAALFDWGKGFDHYHAWFGFSCKPVSDADPSCMTGIGGRAIAAQAIMALVIIAWAGTLSGLAFFVLKMTGKLRIDEETEETGMDLKQHSPPKAYAIGLNFQVVLDSHLVLAQGFSCLPWTMDVKVSRVWGVLKFHFLIFMVVGPRSCEDLSAYDALDSSGDSFCQDVSSYAGPSEGLHDCKAKCDRDGGCKFFSIWMTGGQHWCRLTASCVGLSHQPGHTIGVYKRHQMALPGSPFEVSQPVALPFADFDAFKGVNGTSCDAYPACRAAGLAGTCCPNHEKVTLSCCNGPPPALPGHEVTPVVPRRDPPSLTAR